MNVSEYIEFPVLLVFHSAVIRSVLVIVVSKVVLFIILKFTPSKLNPEFLVYENSPPEAIEPILAAPKFLIVKFTSSFQCLLVAPSIAITPVSDNNIPVEVLILICSP